MDRLPNVTRTKYSRAFDGFVKVNEVVTKPSYRIRPDDVIWFHFRNLRGIRTLSRRTFHLTLCMKIEDLLVVNKPAGMVVHPTFQRVGAHSLMR